MKTMQDRILARIRRKGRGWVFVPTDLLDLDISRGAIDQALSRLARARTIRRVRRGIYYFPKVHPRLGTLSPDPVMVAEAYARSIGARIQPAGAQAANQLGLSTQVPARLVYLTDGATRTVQFGNQAIQFRHVTPRRLTAIGTWQGTIIEALRYLGPEAITDAVVDHLIKTIPQCDRDRLSGHITAAPIWAQRALKQIATAQPSVA